MKETAQQLVTAGKGIMAADLPVWRFIEQLKQQRVAAGEDSYRTWCELQSHSQTHCTINARIVRRVWE